MPEQFCHLHVHSEYSLLDGVIRIPGMVKACVENSMNAVALTDHGVMYGAIELIGACEDKDVKPILGCEVYVADGSRHTRDSTKKQQNSHLVLLALDDTGYRNLSTLVSKAYHEGFYYKPRIDHELLAEYSDGLVATSGCLRGELCRWILANKIDKARETAGFYRDLFGPDRFYIELQDHGLADQARVNPDLIALARELNIPLVATNDCHFLEPEDRHVQDVMICIQINRKLTDTDRFRAYTPNHYFKSPREMAKIFESTPDAISNTMRIAEMVTFKPALNQFHFPEFKPEDGSSPEEYLKIQAHEGLSNRFNGDPPEEYKRRLDFELNIICDMGFASYFLITADFVTWAKRKDIPVGPGRGSAAGCLVSYAVQIVDIDPVHYGLQFERFLNPARISMPDIDIDFDPVGRADVIDYVTKLYGEEHVCQIITFNRLKARGALRDVGRVMDIPLGEVDKVAKLVPLKSDIAGAIKTNPDFSKAYERTDLTRKWIDTAKSVEGLARNASIHAAGVIICRDPIWQHAPVQMMDRESGSVCQYSMDDAEKVGLVKMDFLGLRTLSYLREACENIKAIHGVEIDLLNIPLDDLATFKMLARGDVLGIFQMEGGGMRDLLMAIAPDKLGDLIATIALFRPGPMENDLHNKYARRKNKKEDITYQHELLQPILEETYGVLTYQEQISLILQAIGGIDLGNATVVMKLISKKKERATIAKYKVDFLRGAEVRGVDRGTVRELWKEIEAFSEYGFNKAHSAAYGLIAYQTAYLKANYPLEFYAAYLSSEMNNQDKISLIVDEMKGKEIPVHPPDVNYSHPNFTVEGKGVRYGLAAIKGVGKQAVESIANARENEGSYEDIYQLAARTDCRLVNKGVFEGLISAGACDNLKGNRHSMLEVVADAMEHGRKIQEDAARGQVALFGASGASPNPVLSDIEEFSRKELLRMEKESLGFYLSHHPLENIWDEIKEYTRQKISELEELRDGTTVRIGGMLGWVSKRISKKMQNYAKFNIEDLTDKVDGIIFPQAYSEYGGLLEEDAFVVMKGRVRIDELDSSDDEKQPRKQVQLIAEEIFRYDPDLDKKWTQSLAPSKVGSEEGIDEEIILDDDVDQYDVDSGFGADAAVNIIIDIDTIDKSGISKIGERLTAKNGPTPVILRFLIDGREVAIRTGSQRNIIFSPELKADLLAIPGIQDVKLEMGAKQ